MATRMLRLRTPEPKSPYSKTLGPKAQAPRSRALPAPKRPALRAITGGRRERTYHVEWDGADWMVFSDDGALFFAHMPDREAATDLAIRAAVHDHGAGAEVTVCVGQEDGGSVLAWSSPARR
jgi:hypothetical protein